MEPHHAQSIENVTEYFRQDPRVLALLLGGSIAHGFQSGDSDVDILIVLSEEDYQEHVLANNLTFLNMNLCTYPGGYVDGKYLSVDFIKKVAEKGSEPARFAFDGVKILFSRIDGLAEEIRQASAYPTTAKLERIRRFRAQLEAWKWFCGEARKKNNPYLLRTAVSKMILFGGRLILAHNEMLYPFHKWFLRVLEQAPEKPPGLMACIDSLVAEPTVENVEDFYQMVKGFQDWPHEFERWGAQFMVDSEQNWLHGTSPVDDL